MKTLLIKSISSFITLIAFMFLIGSTPLDSSKIKVSNLNNYDYTDPCFLTACIDNTFACVDYGNEDHPCTSCNNPCDDIIVKG